MGQVPSLSIDEQQHCTLLVRCLLYENGAFAFNMCVWLSGVVDLYHVVGIGMATLKRGIVVDRKTFGCKSQRTLDERSLLIHIESCQLHMHLMQDHWLTQTCRLLKLGLPSTAAVSAAISADQCL